MLWGTPLPDGVVLPPNLRHDEPEPPTPAPTKTPAPSPAPAPATATKRRLPLVLAAVILVLTVAAAGTWWFLAHTDPEAAARDYAGGVCSDIASWRSSIVGANKKLADTLTGAEPAAAQQAAADYFASAARRTEQLSDQIAEHDADGFDGGTAYASRLAAVADQAAGWFRGHERRVRDLDVNTGPVFHTVFDQITATPDDPVDTVVAVVGESSAPGDLSAAYDNVSICRGLQSY